MARSARACGANASAIAPAALRPQERLAELLGARGATLLCEELVLRARLDLDNGRLAHAAIELQARLRGGARRAAAASAARTSRSALDELEASCAAGRRAGRARRCRRAATQLDEEVLRHALGRLEAALRARTAPGFRVK